MRDLTIEEAEKISGVKGTHASVFRKGWKAFNDGLSADQNPYPSKHHTQGFHNTWYHGWNMARIEKAYK